MEKLVLELFVRIKDLEERLDKLESEKRLETNIKKVTRNISREYTIKNLQEKNKGLYAKKGNKLIKADIVLSLNNKDLKVKYFHSKSYSELFPAGWYTINVDDIIQNSYDVYIFVLYYEDNFKTFLFTKEDIEKIIEKKVIDTNGNYHFYIHIKEDGRILECRDIDIDISKNYEDWTLPKRIIDGLQK
ncbi:hypothetical protein [Clostridium perfringens]|uniref:hypothetical protein n=1 Tax=Clostridium perfringens TaxID=1502 RepID=UPI0039EC69D3